MDLLVIGIEWLIDSPDQGDEVYSCEIQIFSPTLFIDSATAMIFHGTRPLHLGSEERTVVGHVLNVQESEIDQNDEYAERGQLPRPCEPVG